MKQIIFFFLLVVIYACSNSNKNTVAVADNNISEQNEQQPDTSNVCEIDLEHIPMGQNGHSTSKDNELTKFLELLQADSCNYITIRWYWDCGAPYNNSIPMRITYEIAEKKLYFVYRESGLTDKYENVTAECLIKFLESGKKDFVFLSDFCNDVKHTNSQQ